MSKHGTARSVAEYALVWPILKTLERLPAPLARAEARGLGFLLRRAAPGLLRVARRNLAMALPELDAPRREEILDGVYASLARSFHVFARFPRLDAGNIGEWIRQEGFEHYQRAREGGRGVLFLTAHLGNWELSALAQGLFGHPLRVVARPLDNPLLERLVARYRTLSGNRILFKTDSPRRILEALRANQAVGMLIDQNASLDNGVFVDFFGVPACASTGLARIALRAGAPIVPGFALWQDTEQRYLLRFWPPVEMTRAADPQLDVQMNTQRLNTLLERIIRQYPDQWLWIHRRWKTRPPGEEAIY